MGTCESYTTSPTCNGNMSMSCIVDYKTKLSENGRTFPKALLTFDHLLKGSRFTPLFIRISAKSRLRV